MKPEHNPPDAASLRARAEAALLETTAPSPESLAALSPEATQRMLHELRVHQIELEMQNEELRRAQLELEASKSRYFDLYDLAPVGYCTVGKNGEIQQANLALGTLLGVVRSALVGKLFSHFILKEDADTFYLAQKQVFAGPATSAVPDESSHSCELYLNRNGGPPVFVNLVMTAVLGESGEWALRVVVTNLTARRTRELAAQLEARTQMAILNAIPAHVALIDPEGIILATNESWRRFATANLLQGPEFSLGQNYLKMCERATGPCSEEARDAAAGIRRVLRGETSEFAIEYPCHSPTEQHWFRLMATPLHEGYGGGAVVMHLNITERKLAGVKIRESATLFRSMADSAPVLIWMSGLDKGCFYFNKVWLDFTGRTLAQEEGNGWAEGVHPEDLARCLEIYVGHFDTRQNFNMEYRLRRADGEFRWLTDAGVPRFDESGVFLGYIGCCIDITGRVQAEDALRKSQALLVSLTESTTDAIFVKDLRGRYLVFNSAASRFVGKPVDEVLGQDDTALFPLEQARQLMAGDQRIMLSGVTQTSEETGMATAFGAVTFLSTKGPIHNAQGEVVGVFGISRDITERRALEHQLRESQKMEAVGQLAGGIAHDFNNILGAIITNAELAKMALSAHPDVSENLDVILASSQRAADLVRQILTFSRRQPTRRQPTCLHLIVRDALKLLRATVPVSIRFESVLPVVPTVQADPNQIQQVILNLVTNAVHATADGVGTLVVELAEVTLDESLATQALELCPGRYVCLTVQDNGCGMSSETRAQIFTPFFTTKEVGEGTGLGLAVVHGIMMNHVGGIVVESQPGQGTTFRLYFPVSEAERAIPPANAPLTIPRGRGEHILLVDDEAQMLRSGRLLLERLGYLVTVKALTWEALAAVAAQPTAFDLVLTDLNMPEMGGVELASEVRAIRPELPLVLTSGYSLHADAQTLAAQGFNAFLAKPYDLRSLAETVHRVLHPTNSPGAIKSAPNLFDTTGAGPNPSGQP